jgi:predicted MFS family arabinose efflux permease
MVMAGLASSLVGIGLARFAYTPLIPVLVEQAWFTSDQVFYLGAANLAGYLAGAVGARFFTRSISVRAVLRGMMLTVALSFLACTVPVSFLWFFVWRFASGFAGAVLMVVAAPAILPHVQPDRRGRASGIIFTGVGLGAAASGTLIPWLLGSGLEAAWIVLGLLSVLLTLLTWRSWPDVNPAQPTTRPDSPAAGTTPSLLLLYGQYGLNAAGLVPHMIFLVDFIARGLGHGFAQGAFIWVVFGLGAMAGPFVLGVAADRFGYRNVLRAGFVLQAAMIALPAMSSFYPAIILSAAIAGAFTPGVVPLVLGRVREIIAAVPERQQAAWGGATASFAGMQAIAAYGLSYLFSIAGSYELLFGLGALCLALALLLDIADRRVEARNASSAEVSDGRIRRKSGA